MATVEFPLCIDITGLLASILVRALVRRTDARQQEGYHMRVLLATLLLTAWTFGGTSGIATADSPEIGYLQALVYSQNASLVDLEGRVDTLERRLRALEGRLRL
jgi:hypothetical protein